jgi:hypothetical protein
MQEWSIQETRTPADISMTSSMAKRTEAWVGISTLIALGDRSQRTTRRLWISTFQVGSAQTISKNEMSGNWFAISLDSWRPSC